jgi:hypothetical protein
MHRTNEERNKQYERENRSMMRDFFSMPHLSPEKRKRMNEGLNAFKVAKLASSLAPTSQNVEETNKRAKVGEPISELQNSFASLSLGSRSASAIEYRQRGRDDRKKSKSKKGGRRSRKSKSSNKSKRRRR